MFGSFRPLYHFICKLLWNERCFKILKYVCVSFLNIISFSKWKFTMAALGPHRLVLLSVFSNFLYEDILILICFFGSIEIIGFWNIYILRLCKSRRNIATFYKIFLTPSFIIFQNKTGKVLTNFIWPIFV